jgi:hypothetical protein
MLSQARVFAERAGSAVDTVATAPTRGRRRVAAGGADAQQPDAVGVDAVAGGEAGDGGLEVLHPLGG